MNDEEIGRRKLAEDFVDWWHNAPFFFTVQFDEQKAAEHGTTAEALLARVDFHATRYGMTRTGYNRWDALIDDMQGRQSAYHKTLLYLSMKKWFMETVSVWTSFSNEAPSGFDMLDLCRRRPLKTY